MSKERLPVSVTAAVFIEDNQDRLLLVQQEEAKGGKWGPPAGGMFPNENPFNTAIREIREEIGVEVELINLIGIYTVFRGENASGIGFVFRGRISGEIVPRVGEIISYRYVDKKQLDEIITNNELYKPEYNISAINDWRNGLSYPLDVIRRAVG